MGGKKKGDLNSRVGCECCISTGGPDGPDLSSGGILA